VSFHFRPAVRENVPLLLGVAGGTGSGKTYSALRLARGLAGDKPFAVIDTENGRALHYADEFTFEHGNLDAPFRPDRYAEAIAAADAAGYPVIVVDSASHEHAGDGGLLDWHEEEYQRLGGRDAVKMTAWIKPKMAHRKFVTKLLQVRAHVILCFRAEEKIDIVKGDDGKTKIVKKATLTGLDGWVPVAEKTLPYELTASFLLTADAPGIPKPIKLQEQHRPFVPLDAPLSEETGRALGEWARGSKVGPGVAASPAAPPGTGANDSAPEWAPESAVTALLELAARVSGEAHDKAVDAIAKHRVKNEGSVSAEWLGRQERNLRAKLPADDPVDEPSVFASMLPADVKAGVSS
jgi:hypothetical protein